MSVASMTGFARFEEQNGDFGFVWEIRSVNGKGLELKTRLPQGFEAVELEMRRVAADRLKRGNVQVSLQLRRDGEQPAFFINQDMLAQLVELSSRLVKEGNATLPSADGLLSIKGVIDVAENPVDQSVQEARQRAVLKGFGAALDRLVAARLAEGEALKQVLLQRLDAIESLVAAAEADTSRSPEAIRRRLQAQVEMLLGSDERLEAGRLHQEAAVLAAKADVREEIDRLAAHVEAARALLDQGGPIGRRLDFLSQEFNRESNTICSKSNAASLTTIGLELKVIVDQFREQVQNIE
ncbi:YicC/YloC family endoribonuclease [Consotaella salsifontis]|uniref:TIGR00255 family protein n=1 Tax=Consotaella salsifontis TaxID=1365950 RepID=A0A1T4SKK6_9HYPH|nr:YicC/YloC family endoribonuclease [Consotaella salsifontis]SKA28732.1 TIGR00255 family protein [Consotaella salsifontis]